MAQSEQGLPACRLRCQTDACWAWPELAAPPKVGKVGQGGCFTNLIDWDARMFETMVKLTSKRKVSHQSILGFVCSSNKDIYPNN